MNTIRCIHRHTIKMHPNCFRLGRVLQVKDEVMKKKLRTELTPVKYRKINVGVTPWYQHPGTRIGYFDIETSNFTANNGHLLSWAIKEKGKNKIVHEEVIRKELLEGTFDLRILKTCLTELRKYDIIVTYYGTRFDIPFIRTRAEYWYQRKRREKKELLVGLSRSALVASFQRYLPDDRKVPTRTTKLDLVEALLDRDEELGLLEFPEYGSIVHFDLYYLVRAKFRFHRNSLGMVTEFFGIKGKTHLTPEQWMNVRLADVKVMKILKEHNLEDVKILEKLHEIASPYRKWNRRSI